MIFKYLFSLLSFFYLSNDIIANAIKKSDLTLEFPKKFHCDSVFVLIKNNFSEKIYCEPFYGKEKMKFKNILLQNKFERNSIKIFLTNSAQIKDTLYFLSKNKDAYIKFTSGDYNNFELKNVYYFDYLFAKFSPILQSQNNAPRTTAINSDSLFKSNILSFIEKNIDNPYSIDLFGQFVLRNNLFDYQTSKVFFDTYINPLPLIPQIRNDIDKLLNAKTFYSQLNVVAPNFDVINMKNENLSSQNLRGRYILINFWATWCVPCIEELPQLTDLITKYKDKNFTAISVSLDDNLDILKKFVSNHDMFWNQVAKDQNILTSFGVNPIPQTFIINPDGIIVYNKILQIDNDKNLEVLSRYCEENIK